MIRDRANLGDRIDFDLTGGPPPGVPYWLEEGPSGGTQVTVPPDTETVYVRDDGVEVGLTPEAVLPAVAVYERDLNSAGGGFNVFRYRRTLPLTDVFPVIMVPADETITVQAISDPYPCRGEHRWSDWSETYQAAFHDSPSRRAPSPTWDAPCWQDRRCACGNREFRPLPSTVDRSRP